MLFGLCLFVLWPFVLHPWCFLLGHYYTLSMELYSDRWKQLYMAKMDFVTDPEMIIHYRIGKTEEIVYSSVLRKSDF